MPRMDATSPRAQKSVQQADARLTDLLHLADALPEFAVSPAFGGAAGGDGGTVTDVMAHVLAEQEALASRLGAGATTPLSARLGDGEALSQHAHRPYGELRDLIRERHDTLREAVIAGDDNAVDAFEQLGKRYVWAHSVLGQCAL